jgi:hypothetical protein
LSPLTVSSGGFAEIVRGGDKILIKKEEIEEGELPVDEPTCERTPEMNGVERVRRPLTGRLVDRKFSFFDFFLLDQNLVGAGATRTR